VKDGERRLRDALKRYQKLPRTTQPQPYDDDWGWWIEQRLQRLETGQKWLLRLALGTLAAELGRILLPLLHPP